MIERLERMKAVLYQESLTSITADAIACRLSCWRAGDACPRGAARALVLHACARAWHARTNFIFLCCVVHACARGVRACIVQILLFPRGLQTGPISLSVWWIHPTFPNRGTAYNSRSFAGNLLFVGDYGIWCSSTTIFTVSSIMLMLNLVKFWFPWQLLQFLRFSIVISS
jgi:hypothetical protein